MIGKFNPLNIRTSSAFNWVGQTGATRGFCDFQSVEYCRRAGLYLLMRSYRRAGVVRLGEILHRFAPVSENDTERYISFVCARTGFNANMTLMMDSDFAAVLAAMEIYEQGIITARREEYFATAKQSYLYLIDYFKIKRA